MVINPPVIPATEPPSGPAGGELSGTYPNPAVAAALPHTETLGPALGRALSIGDAAALDHFGALWQSEVASPTQGYALAQFNDGSTFLNALGGKQISIRINNVEQLNVDANGNLVLALAGKGLKVKEGANARMGVATLNAGTVTIANTSITASTRIFLSQKNAGAGPTLVAETARVAGTSFTVGNGNALDSSTVVSWLLFEPSP